MIYFLLFFFLSTNFLFGQVQENAANFERDSSEILNLLEPLIPLEPQFPLAISEKNQIAWMNGPEPLEREKKHIQSALLRQKIAKVVVGLFCLLAALGWCLYVLRDHLFKKIDLSDFAPTAQEQLANRFEELKLISTVSCIKGFHVLSSLLIEWLEIQTHLKLKPLTTQEIELLLIQHHLNNKNRATDAVELLKKIDQIKFGSVAASDKDLQLAIERYQWILQGCQDKSLCMKVE